MAHSIVLSVLLKEYPRLPWSKLLNKSSLHVMSVLKNDSLNIKEISYVTGLHRNTISSVINSLSMYGVILKSNGCYYLNQKHRISDFIDYYWNYINNKKLKKLAKEGTIIWQRGSEFLFKTDTLLNTSEDGRLQPTALTMFPNYDLKIMSEFHYYFYSKQKLRVEDYILHTILISPENAIYNTYALALYSKSDVSKTELMEYARYYNLKDHVEILLKYLDYREKINEYTLPWSEHREIIDSLV
ncbi:hypothetical protein [Methanohalobium evestigatum]|uniref:hypothetical protein n=1 Tax=Methanohalobium evestigatum TaxID=2322 RepID=UPI0012F6E727|nr:hypothetical protein [Methanohalobium evestigatum]